LARGCYQRPSALGITVLPEVLARAAEVIQ
jgi:hypothetical protein